jgi:hypothetical protein
MKRSSPILALCAALALVQCGGDDDDSPTNPDGTPTMSFFVSSTTTATGNLGGLRAADARCQSLATSAGVGNKRWRAYLSVARDADNGNRQTDARSRIGNGPWYNAKGMLVAQNLTDLHARKGDATVFLDEKGVPINGQWPGSPRPVEHDILTGTSADGTLMTGLTCNDWTSDATGVQAQVGHSDGLGPGGDPSGNFGSWNSSHTNADCSNTAPRGGAGRIYCFAAN